MSHTKEQITAAIELAKTVADMIKAATETSPLKGIPSGELYARLMPALPSLTVETYNSLIDLLKRSGIVKESNYLLSFIVEKGK